MDLGRDGAHRGAQTGAAVIAALALAALLLAPGCTFKGGPGEHGWLRFQIWTAANLEVDTPVGSLCLGCLEVDVGGDPNAP